jgi:hypothetical protein
VKKNRRFVLCYRSCEWELVNLGPEARAGWEVALERVRTLPHDAASLPLEHWLASAYLQGVLDGCEQVADRLKELEARP